MSNPTTPFSWQMPTATDLVTDLPADFAVFGQAVATSMADLLGGTTGQILAKASATDMDFSWIANDQGDITGVTAGTGITVTSPTGPVPTVAIDTAVTVDKTTAQTLTNKTLTSPALTTPTISTATTNGDILYGTGSGALARLGIGSTSQVLSVVGGIPAWSTPASGSLTLLSTTTLTSTSVTVSSISGSYSNLYIRIDNLGTGGAAGICRMTVNSVTNYIAVGVDSNPTGVFTASANIPLSGNRNMKDTGGDNKVAVINIYNYAASGTYKAFDVVSAVTGASGGDATTSASGNIQNTSAITSVTVSMSAGSFDGSPSMKIYGVN